LGIDKKRTNLLRKELIRYCENNKIYLNNKVKESIDFLIRYNNGFYSVDFLKIWLICDEKTEKYFDFNGAKIPDITNDKAQMQLLLDIFMDAFLFSCLLNDDYNKVLFEQFDSLLPQGPYGYVDNDFDVTIKKNDLVIDAGAWIGDFSAYAASKDAVVYAFEPVSINYETLVKTALLNGKNIIPIKKALGNKNEERGIKIPKDESYGSSLDSQTSGKEETIEVITLDEFVEKELIKKVDFIKADIEGWERYLLKGAKKILKEFAPKLAICTYHNPEDPKLLERIILEANSKYCVIHTRHLLFAMIKK